MQSIDCLIKTSSIPKKQRPPSQTNCFSFFFLIMPVFMVLWYMQCGWQVAANWLVPQTCHTGSCLHSDSWYLLHRPLEVRRLSWPGWLVTCRDGLPACRQSPIQVLTGPGAGQLRWLETTCLTLLHASTLAWHFYALYLQQVSLMVFPF